MKCSSTRNRILALDHPAQLPTEVAAHVVGCEGCALWHRQLVRIENAIPLLPLPVASGAAKAALLQTLRAGSTPKHKAPSKNHQPVAVKDRPWTAPARQSWGDLAGKLWPAGLIAATILIGTVAWLSLRSTPPTLGPSSPQDPMLEVAVRANLELAAATSPENRVEALAKLADELHQEMRDIARVDPTGENMSALQQMYQKVVLQGIVPQARPKLLSGTPPEQKVFLEQLAGRLDDAGKQAEQLASEVPQVSVRPLREVAEAARQGTKRIRELLEGV